ncbi:MAG TPA: YqgE/AlgH family protein [Jatrophihabitans sp.]|jgi:putative transcriptional regulator|uniref:YqgE/AlgH family protein n=1 Tax=Jatrophihabitans sp. TaxID=1932789 RepID=UPI002E064648|nr:YqgE/AlgH family protein [Jatrophihabitans sp.]
MAAVNWGAMSGLEPAAGRLLVATPLLGDPHFARTVVYLLEHDGGGTVGVVLNRPSHTPVGQVLPDWHDAASGPAVVFGGGPVQPDGALCLGELEPGTTGIREVVDGVSTIDLDGDVAVVAPIARRLRVFAGHAGWSPGQLDDEMAEGAWWVVLGSPADLFSEDPRTMWRRVLRRQPPPLSLMSTFPEDPSLN